MKGPMQSIFIFFIAAISVSSTFIPASETTIAIKNPDKKQTDQLSQKQTESVILSKGKKDKVKKQKHRTHTNDQAANRRAVWGFIFGLASVFIFPILAIPGLILSNDALREDRIHPRTLTKTNRTLAFLGKYLSYVGIAIIILAILYLGFLLSLLSGWG
jgi:hypothetical protein